MREATSLRKAVGERAVVAAHQCKNTSPSSGSDPWILKRESVMPDLSRERAVKQQVLHGLGLLVVERTNVVVRKAMPRKPGSSPAAIVDREPGEHSDSQRSPRAQDLYIVLFLSFFLSWLLKTCEKV